MTLKGLLVFFENYYGEKYSGVFLDAMVGYLEGRPGYFYEAVAQVLVRRYSRSFNKAPGPCEIENNLDEIYKTMDKIQSWALLSGPKEEATENEIQNNSRFMTNLLNKMLEKTRKRRRND